MWTSYLRRKQVFVIVETFLNPGEASSAEFRVRPIPGQIYPVTMRVQCSRAMRKAYPLGTRFFLPVQVVTNTAGTQFLKERGSAPWQVV